MAPSGVRSTAAGHLRWLVVGVAGLAALGCTLDATATGHSPLSRIDNTPLDPGLLLKARARGQLCSIAAGRKGENTIQVRVVARDDLPFAIPSVKPLMGDGVAPGRLAVQLVNVGTPKQRMGEIAVSCIVPVSLTDEEFRRAIRTSQSSGLWRSIVMSLALSEPIRPSAFVARETREAREAYFEYVGAERGTLGSQRILGNNSQKGSGIRSMREVTPCGETVRASANSTLGDLPPVCVTASAEPWVAWLQGLATKLCGEVGYCHELSAWEFTEAGGGGPSYGGGSQYTVDEAVLFWSTAAHDLLLENGLKDTPCEWMMSAVKKTSARQDLLHTQDNVRHYLRSPFQNASDARDASESWINQNLAAARSFYSPFNGDSVTKYFGQALHTMMDKTSPAHTDVDGMPYAFPYPPGTPKPLHSLADFLGGEGTGELTSQLMATNKTAMVSSCAYVTSP